MYGNRRWGPELAFRPFADLLLAPRARPLEHMSAQALDIETLRAWAVQHHLPPAAVERWLQMGESDALAMLAVAQELRLRTGQLLTALDLLEEIGVREGTE